MSPGFPVVRMLVAMGALSMGQLVSLGKTVDSVHAHVAAIAADGAGATAASGVLIHERIVLTAGHVIGRPPVDRIAVFGGDLTDPAAIRIRAADYQPHPSLVDLLESGASPSERETFLDLGLVFLDAPAPGIMPATLPSAGLLDQLRPADRLTAFGYGAHQVSGPRGLATPSPPDGRRRTWRVGVAALLNSSWLRLDDDPSKGFGQLCHGDSGGPILLERGGRETLVAMISHSDSADCGAGIPTFAQRIDSPRVLDWMRTEATRRGLTLK